MAWVNAGVVGLHAQTDAVGTASWTEGEPSIVHGAQRLVAVVDQSVLGNRVEPGRGRLEIRIDPGAREHISYM